MKVTIKRSEWYRGHGSSASALLRARDGQKCCLGFACLAAGLTPEQIMSERSVADLRSKKKRIPRSLLKLVTTNLNNSFSSALGDELMFANDYTGQSDHKREKELKALGLKAGLEFKFVD